MLGLGQLGILRGVAQLYLSRPSERPMIRTVYGRMATEERCAELWDDERSIETCAIVGTGAAARVLAPSIRDAGVRVTAVGGRDQRAVKALARVVGAQAWPLREVAVQAELVILAVRDDAVGEVAAAISAGKNLESHAVVHLAGGVDVSLLAPVKDAGGQIGKMHPLASFPRSGSVGVLRHIVWGITGDPELVPRLHLLVRRLGGRPLILDDVNAPLYHAAAVCASSFVIALLDVANALWTASGAQMASLNALLPLLRGVLDNAESLGLAQALTGPIARGDSGAVAEHLAAVHAFDPDSERLYRALAWRVLAIAASEHALTPSMVADMASLLRDSSMVQ